MSNQRTVNSNLLINLEASNSSLVLGQIISLLLLFLLKIFLVLLVIDHIIVLFIYLKLLFFRLQFLV